MARDSGPRGGSTRRSYLGRAGALVAGGLLAGCIGGCGHRREDETR
ncbi:hypothetical protein ACFQMA_07505 [Halosimplex aquaticum]|uniref:TAT (Twin-arginine translocation) pathway signal sequence n=1 Tax=Halosimplex aquaticum TaxID=3026162 RepID=A0ABD5Y1C4_9EURY|nr:hypothetical protein [Halosimplex aquaticum]